MKKITVITQPCYQKNFKPLGAIQGSGKSFDDLMNNLRANALAGTTHIFNTQIDAVHSASRWTAIADCFKQINNEE